MWVIFCCCCCCFSGADLAAGSRLLHQHTRQDAVTGQLAGGRRLPQRGLSGVRDESAPDAPPAPPPAAAAAATTAAGRRRAVGRGSGAQPARPTHDQSPQVNTAAFGVPRPLVSVVVVVCFFFFSFYSTVFRGMFLAQLSVSSRRRAFENGTTPERDFIVPSKSFFLRDAEWKVASMIPSFRLSNQKSPQQGERITNLIKRSNSKSI